MGNYGWTVIGLHGFSSNICCIFSDAFWDLCIMIDSWLGCVYAFISRLMCSVGPTIAREREDRSPIMATFHTTMIDEKT